MNPSIVRIAALAPLLVAAAGCGSIINAGAGEIAGIVGAAVADAVTTNAGVAAGIGLGAQAGARATVQYAQRRIHRVTQERIADAAGPLGVGEVAAWRTEQRAPLEEGEQGRVTVSRVIATAAIECKEIVFSVDPAAPDGPRSAFYVATVCRDGGAWRWAQAEPSTARWGGLQ